MKTNFYIFIILFFSFSVVTAQSDVNNTIENKVEVSQLNESTIIIDTVKIKETIARSSSDIRIFLNRERNVDNIKLVFPKIYKRKLA